MANFRQISEPDWKIWRELQKQALERFAQKTLDECAAFKQGAGTAHERYLKLYRLVERRDKKMSELFDDPKRSNAFFQIAAAAQAGLISSEELERFSPETQGVIDLITS